MGSRGKKTATIFFHTPNFLSYKTMHSKAVCYEVSFQFCDLIFTLLSYLMNWFGCHHTMFICKSALCIINFQPIAVFSLTLARASCQLYMGP